MALPKKRKLDVGIKTIGFDDGPKNWVNQFKDQNKQFLPREVDLTDLDQGFLKFIDEDLRSDIGYIDIPVHFLGVQRWYEFAKTWKSSDKYKNVKIPFISITRETAPEVGTNPADFKIPIRKNFPYLKIPTWDGNRKGGEVYMIPNPVGVDLKYMVRFFTFKMRELNEIYKKISELFASAQAYVNIKGHYFPVLLENVGDESQIEDIDGKRYYTQVYEMRLQGYIVDSEEFEVKPLINRLFVTTEIITKKPKPIVNKICDVVEKDRIIRLVIHFLPNAYTELRFASEDDVNILSIDTENITSYNLRINGEIITLPYELKKDDIIFLSIVKTNSTEPAEIKFNGTLM